MPYKIFRFRLYPSSGQKIFFENTFGCSRFVYNYFLRQKIESYQNDGKSLSYSQCAKELSAMKKLDEYRFLKEVDSIALQQALRHLEKAFDNFYKREGKGFPKFKTKKKSRQSYTTIKVNKNMVLGDGVLRLPKIGEVRMKQHRMIPNDYILKRATVIKNAIEQYYVSLVFFHERQVEEISINTVLGLDFSPTSLYVDSNGGKAEIPVSFSKIEKRLAFEQKALSRMEKGSENWMKQKQRVAKLYEKRANQRKDYLHKQSFALAEEYDCICIETLSIQKMMSNRTGLNRKMVNSGWEMFTSYLSYKMEERGKRLIKVDRFFPSSQLCHSCGEKNPALKDLKVREWTCPSCGKFHNRDLNAAINIKNEGIRIMFG